MTTEQTPASLSQHKPSISANPIASHQDGHKTDGNGTRAVPIPTEQDPHHKAKDAVVHEVCTVAYLFIVNYQ